MLAATVVLLIARVLVLLPRTEVGASPTEDRWSLSRMGSALTALPGVRFLLGRLDLGWAGIDAKGKQLLQEGAALEVEALVEALLRTEELDAEEAAAILGARPG